MQISAFNNFNLRFKECMSKIKLITLTVFTFRLYDTAQQKLKQRLKLKTEEEKNKM